jgi:hypothetical protein
MMMIMLQDFGPLALPSGFIYNDEQGAKSSSDAMNFPPRQSLVFKDSKPVDVNSRDLLRFVVSSE